MLDDISIHVPREGHDRIAAATEKATAISIHVPREGHDYPWTQLTDSEIISIHVPREGHDRHQYHQQRHRP